MAPEGRKAEYLNAFQLSTGVKSVVGPILMTAVILPAATAGWAILAALVAAGSAFTVAVARSVISTPDVGVRP